MDQLSNPSQSWPYVLLRAASAIVFGLVSLLMPAPTLAALVLVFGAYMVADGVFAAVSGVRAARKHERWGWFALEAVVNVAAGVVAFLWPGITVLVFVTIMAAWALLSGAAMLFGAFRFQQEHGRAWLVLGGIVSIVWGLLMAFWPLAGAVALTLWLGAYALVFGVTLLLLAIRLRREARKTGGQPQAPVPASQNQPS